jgi:hypothetical protein
MRKRIAIAVTLLVVLGLALIVWLGTGRRGPPQIITAQNGQQYRFIGVTYGTNHVMGSPLGKIVARLPRPVAGFVRGILGRHLGSTHMRNTRSPSLSVWFEPVGSNTPPGPMVYAFLADENGAMAGSQQGDSLLGIFLPSGWMEFAFEAIPHRSRRLECRLFEWGSKGTSREIGRVHFDNPAFGQFPQWVPESLPATAMAGDLEVRLDHFIAGVSAAPTPRHGGTNVTYPPAAEGEDPRAAFDLDFRPAHRNQKWILRGSELSDATGNHLRANGWGATGNHFSIGATLWPGEAAWRLKLELKRTAGFDVNELVTFKGVAIPAMGETNQLSITNESGGVRLALKKFIRRARIEDSPWDDSQATEIQFGYFAPPKDMSIDFVSVEAGNHQKVEIFNQSWSDTAYTISIKTLPPDMDHLDITFAVQKIRTAEFMVKPVQIGKDR